MLTPLEFSSYQSIQFDENETCIGGTTSPWSAHKFDSNMAGKFSLTIMLNVTGSGAALKSQPTNGKILGSFALILWII